MKIDITPFQNPEELIQEIVKQRVMLKEKTGKPNIVRLIFHGGGALQKAIGSPEGQAYILQTLNDKEKFHHLFNYFSEIIDETSAEINLEERRQLPDVLGNYLSAFDTIGSLPEKKRMEKLHEIVKERQEVGKFSELKNFISDEMLLRAFKKAEREGARLLSEDEE